MRFPKHYEPNLQIHYNGARQGYEFFLTLPSESGSGNRRRALPMQFEEYNNSTTIEPFFVLRDGNDGILQQMLDALWRYGIRPTDLGTIDSTLAAKDEHLKDLKTLLFHKMGVKP